MRKENTRNLFHDLSSVSNRLLDSLDDIRVLNTHQNTDYLLFANALVMRTTTATISLNLLGTPSLLSVALTKLCARKKQRITVTDAPPLTLYQLADWCDLCNAIALFTAELQPGQILLEWLSTEDTKPTPTPIALLTLTAPPLLCANSAEAAISSALAFSRCQAKLLHSDTSSSMTLLHSIDALVRIDDNP